MGDLWRDVWFGARSLLKRPGITAISVLALALGIGANTAIFSVVDAVLIRPLPYAQPDRIVFLGEASQQIPDMSIAMENFRDWQKMNTVFESMLAYRTNGAVLTGSGDAERVLERQISSGFEQTLGVKPILGRTLSPDDDKAGAIPVVLLSDGFWARKFGRDPNILGKKLALDGVDFTIIGVLPSSHFHTSWRSFSVFTSLWRHEPALGGPANRGSHPGMYAYARLKPGVTFAQAQDQMRDIAARLAKQYPKDNTAHTVQFDTLIHAIVGDEKPALFVLMAAVGFVLLIACANVANLMLARGSERRREMAIRTAMGATRGRLIRQLLTENFLLATAGGALGLLIGGASTGAMASAASVNMPRVEDVSLDGRVLFFTICVSLLTTFVFGMMPAIQSTQVDVQESLKQGGRGATGAKKHTRIRSTLVVAEVAISMVLLAGAGLMLKSLYRVLITDPGFVPEGALTAEFGLPDNLFKTAEQRAQFVDHVVAKLEALPGVQAAGLESPLLGGWQQGYIVEGRPMPTLDKVPSVDMDRVTPGSFRAMGVRLLRGRVFDAHDNAKTNSVVIIDERFAQEAFGNDDPLGKRVAVTGTLDKPIWSTIVGVVAHVKNYGVDQPSRDEAYLCNDQDSGGGGSVVLKTSGDPSSFASAVREVFRAENPDVPVARIRSLSSIVDDNTAQRRLSVTLLGVFASIALLLAAIGLYGVMSYSVTQRTHEIGVRVALGAERGDVLRMVLGNGFTLVGVGLACGLAGSLAVTRSLQAQLFEVGSADFATFSAITVLLAGIALIATYLPALRATRVDPIVALRNE